jgi:two-component system nitrogen regulation response regulator GlnG
MKQSLLTARGNVLLPDFLPPLGDQGGKHWATDHSGYLTEPFVAERLAAGTGSLYEEAISRAERQLFRQVLTHTHGNQYKAALLLGISRVTLRSKLKQLGIDAVDFNDGK